MISGMTRGLGRPGRWRPHVLTQLGGVLDDVDAERGYTRGHRQRAGRSDAEGDHRAVLLERGVGPRTGATVTLT